MTLQDETPENESLPTFKYHPDPIGTGSIEPSEQTCIACGKARGYIYVGLTFAEEEIIDCLCPWCIADGTAHRLFDAEFNDRANIGGGARGDKVPAAVEEVVAYRTPGFNAWQGGAWFTHCGDAAAFLGVVGREELEAFGREAVEGMREESGYTDDDWNRHFERLERYGSPTAYLFRCLHCGTYGGFSDFD